MIKTSLAVAALVALAAPVFAQDVQTMTCAKYNELDEGQRNGLGANIQSWVSQSSIQRNVKS